MTFQIGAETLWFLDSGHEKDSLIIDGGLVLVNSLAWLLLIATLILLETTLRGGDVEDLFSLFSEKYHDRVICRLRAFSVSGLIGTVLFHILNAAVASFLASDAIFPQVLVPIPQKSGMTI